MACGNQRTVGSPASLAGTSLHTGQPVTLTLKPAPADFGIKFRRVDIPDQPFINADVEKVQTVERATSLAEGSVKVHTVEHILSALTGMGIDNAVIEMDANEPPIGDGSSAPYVELIKSAGIVEQEVPRRYLEVRDSIMDTEAKRALYTRQQFMDMMDVIVEMYGNQFTTDDMLDAETGMTPDSIVMEFALMDVSVGEKVDKRTEDFAKNFTNGK